MPAENEDPENTELKTAELPDPETKLYVKEQCEKARKEALGIFAFIAVIIAIGTGLGIWNGARAYIDEQMKADQLNSIRERAEKSASAAASSAAAAQTSAGAANSFAANASAGAAKINELLAAIRGIALVRVASDVYNVPDNGFSASGPEGSIAAEHIKHISPIIRFSQPFKDKPTLQLTYGALDFETLDGHRIFTSCIPTNITNEGFQIEIRCLRPTRVTGNSNVRWTALGQ